MSGLGAPSCVRMPAIGDWRPIQKYREMPEEERVATREKYFIEATAMFLACATSF